MKKILLIPVLLMMLCGLGSCSKSNDSTAIIPTSSIITVGNWKITYFVDNGSDHTSNYAGLKLIFISNGTVTSSNDLFSVNGTWVASLNTEDKLLLNFNTGLQMEQLNHDWHILEKTSIKLRMEDVSGGGGGTRYLTIEKI